MRRRRVLGEQLKTFRIGIQLDWALVRLTPLLCGPHVPPSCNVSHLVDNLL
ncbi:uncharacterized protein SCHCODRAFT_02140843 [Schizophyllum commune H4-8]|uniref:uncharacterized protein n=1 Tax=Schizophyllum commune (strain H4-8 / FGSC 9210) TaxID=578458 RepID=UPI0021607F97|nr:uncharacterized protein SCHCODRAFT_02140843 [Schizophyllum commune H4-8]KAI5897395.1 hypothetical protein SCHCODRAFT_02140843 [Schizophyllum commune H4-8]